MRRPSRQGLLSLCMRPAQSRDNRAATQTGCFSNPGSILVLALVHTGRACIATVLMCTFSSLCLHAQSSPDVVRQYFDSVRTGSRVALPDEIYEIRPEEDVLELVRPFLEDSVQSVRIRSRQLLFTLASATASRQLRRKIIDYVLIRTQPKDPASTGLVLNRIKRFKCDDFGDTARVNVRRLVLAEGTYSGEWFRVAAFLGMSDLIPHIRPYTQPGNPQSLRWSALVSLARLEDPSAVAEVVRRVRKLPVNDDLIYNIFPDLIFTRERAALDYMIEILNQEEKNCLSADAEHDAPVLCGYRIMEQLAPVIEGFPVNLDPAGDLLTDDYPATLNAVRQWLSVHHDFGVKKDQY